MIARSRPARLVSAAATVAVLWIGCSKPAEEVPSAAIAEAPAPTTGPAIPADEAAMAGVPQIEPSGPVPAPQIVVTTIDPSNCAIVGNKGATTVLDWQPADPRLPAEMRWQAAGKPPGMRLVITPLTGAGEQSPDPARQQKLLAMFDARYEIGPDADSVLSKLPQYPPFDASEARWHYQAQVLDAQGKVLCSSKASICVREPGGCQE